MGSFNEKTTVEKYIIEKLVEAQWDYIPGAELGREDASEPLLAERLEQAISKLNKDIDLDEEELKELVNGLRLKTASREGLKEILQYIKEGYPVKRKKDNRLKYIKLVDYEDVERNEFIVSNQVIHKGIKESIIPDIILYVNGIPLVIIECKNPADSSTDWYDGFEQIKDYEQLFPELFKYCQFGIAARVLAKYFPIVPWEEDPHIYEWRTDVLDPLDATLEMLSKDTLLDLVRNFIFFREEKGKATRIMARYMQYRAANKIFDRVTGNLEGRDDKDRGLIWHWQGSGKTLTMVFAAVKLYYHKLLENPSVFFIVDRVELEEQLNREFGTLDTFKPEVIGNIRKLKSVLLHDEGRGKRGLMITLVHKFKPKEFKELVKDLEEKTRQQETFLSRRNIVSLVDEGHRTQYGLLAGQMKNVLRNSFFFAFTGTPIEAKGRNTYAEFSYPDKGEPYLDRYFITDSIRDNYTLKIAYQPRLERDVKLDREMLETFLDQDLDEIPESMRSEVEARVKRKLNRIKVFLKHPGRIEKIAEDIAEHFSENIDGKFKGMMVAVDREACVMFKRELDKHLPAEYSEVVMTFTSREKEPKASYKDELKARYKTDDMDAIRKNIIEKFKDEEFPKILIVTDMLLTGFDAPALQVMYLYKPLKDHRLLQALARTNRPVGELKEHGLIIDYLGLFDEIGKAFSKYAKEDIKGVLWDIEAIKGEFIKLVSDLMANFTIVGKDKYDRKTLLKACSILVWDDQKSKEFTRGYKKLRRIFELLGSQTIKLDYLEDYKWLSAVYIFYERLVRRQDPAVIERYTSKYFKKTVESIYKTTEIDKIRKDLPLIGFDENYLKRLEEKFKGKEEKAANIVFALNRFILVERSKNPLYESLVEKVERLVRDWKERKKSIEQLYKEGVALINDTQAVTRRQREIGAKNIEYAVVLALDDALGQDKGNLKIAREIIKEVSPEAFKGWQMKSSGIKAVGRAVRLKLVEMGQKKEKLDKLFDKIMKGLDYYG